MHSICQLNVVNFFHKNFFHTCLVGCWICICNTVSQYPGWIHLAEFYGENRSRKINTWGKGFGLFITPLALYNLVHPGDRFVSISLIAFLVFPVKTLLRGITQENFWKFDIFSSELRNLHRRAETRYSVVCLLLRAIGHVRK